MRKFIIFILFFAWCQIVMAQDGQVHPHLRLIHVGDNWDWLDPDYNDEGWHEFSLEHVGNHWMRFEIDYDSLCQSFTYPGVRIISMGAYEFYWDGIKIAESGKVGKTKADEIPGLFISQVILPDSLRTEGRHEVAMCVSNHHSPLITETWNTFYIEEYGASINRELRVVAVMYILAGIYLMASIYFSLLYFLRKREKEGLIFSVLCLLFFALIVLEYLKFFVAYTYDYHIIRLLGIYSLTFLITFLTPYFFIEFFELPYKKRIIWILLILLVLASIPFSLGTDYTNRFLAFITWISSMAIVGYALYKKKKEAGIILGALILSGAVVTFANIGFEQLLYSYDLTLFISFSLLVIAMMYVLVQRAREQRNAYEASLLMSARLQNELLKKNIQPHFIMNTLTSLMEWIEESPKDSIQFIEALSKEFEIMSAIAEKKLIPIEQEIELCAYHIEIMKYRKEINYIFEQEGIDPKEEVPPAIFHTLIENGITHSLVPPDRSIKMRLSYEKKPHEKLYRLEIFAPNRRVTTQKEGTGLKYIKSRLQENYGKDWQVDGGPTEEGWLTQIRIHV